MSSRKQKAADINAIIRGIFVLLLLGYGGLASFWGGLNQQQKWVFGILGTGILVLAVAMVIVFQQYRKQKRKEAWQKAVKAWNQNVKSGKVASFHTAEDLSPQALEKLAMQVYKQMGYQVNHTGQTGDHGVDVRLVDPNGKVELVQCKQWHKPVGEPEVRDLMGAIVHEKAAKGYIWAPNGFSASAKQWAKGKPILLMDNEEIGRLVESVYVN
jgi:restriction endonuclease Mrr